jgi:hypothetical protein
MEKREFKTSTGGNSMALNNQNTATDQGGSRKNEIQMSQHYTLSLIEAGQYFHIGVKRLRRLAECNIGNFSVRCGNRYLIVRPKFEEFLINNSYV